MDHSSDDEADKRAPSGSSQRNMYTDMEISLEKDYMKTVEKKKQKIYKQINKIKFKLSQLNQRKHVEFRKESKKLELVHCEKLRLMNLYRHREMAKIEREFFRDQQKLKNMNNKEWAIYMSEELLRNKKLYDDDF